MTSHLLSFFSSPGPLGHVSYCHHFSSVVCRPSVNISHFNLLLRNHWTNCNQTLVEWSLDGPLSKLCPLIPTSNQDGRHFKIVSDSPALLSRWPLLLKIEISSNGQNCSILSQNVPKFELCKHNDELFSIYYRILYEL